MMTNADCVIGWDEFTGRALNENSRLMHENHFLKMELEDAKAALAECRAKLNRPAMEKLAALGAKE